MPAHVHVCALAITISLSALRSHDIVVQPARSSICADLAPPAHTLDLAPLAHTLDLAPLAHTLELSAATQVNTVLISVINWRHEAVLEA